MFNTDLALFHSINNMAGSNPALDAVMAAIAKQGPAVYALILLWLWFGRVKGGDLAANRKAVIYAVCSAFLGLGINQIIGHIWFRPRPYAENAVHLLLDRSPDPSFPSDHATGGFALASMLFSANGKAGLLSLTFAALLAFSRVYTGAHYPLDVLGGAVTGLTSTVIITLLRRKLEPLADSILAGWQRIQDKVFRGKM